MSAWGCYSEARQATGNFMLTRGAVPGVEGLKEKMLLHLGLDVITKLTSFNTQVDKRKQTKVCGLELRNLWK